jgi:hypothetical protein
MLLSSGDSFPHLIQKRSSQLGFVTYLLNYLRTKKMVRISDEQSQYVMGYCYSNCLHVRTTVTPFCQDIQSADRRVILGHPECIRYHSVYMNTLREVSCSFSKFCLLCDGLN